MVSKKSKESKEMEELNSNSPSIEGAETGEKEPKKATMPPSVPSEIADSDCQEIEDSIKRSLQKRKEAIALLITLEDAWKTGVSPELSPKNPDVQKGNNKPPRLKEAETKREEVEKLKNSIFSSFEGITKAKHQNQIDLAQEILDSLPAKNLDEMITITEKTQAFIEKENHINKQFLKDIEDISTKTDFFINEIQRVLDMPCQDHNLEALLTKDLKLLKNFLKATKKLLNG